MGQSGTLQHARGGDRHTRSGARDRRTVLSVPDVTRAKFASATGDNGEARIANQRTQFSVENFVPDPKFTAASGVVTDVEAPAGALIAEDGDASQTGKRVTSVLGSKGVGRNKKSRLPQRLVELAGRQITGTEKKIVAPLSTAVSDIHEGDAGPRGKVECCYTGTVYVAGQSPEGRPK